MEEKDATQKTGKTSLSQGKKMSELDLSDPAAITPIISMEGLRSFMVDDPQIRRWYLARVYAPEGGREFVDLYFSPVTQQGQSALTGLDPIQKPYLMWRLSLSAEEAVKYMQSRDVSAIIGLSTVALAVTAMVVGSLLFPDTGRKPAQGATP